MPLGERVARGLFVAISEAYIEAAPDGIWTVRATSVQQWFISLFEPLSRRRVSAAVCLHRRAGPA
eukprot:15459503-Alexandrium_andersonii.AAC.1